MAVDQWFWQTCGTWRVDHPDGMTKWHLFKNQFTSLLQKFIPYSNLFEIFCRCVQLKVRHQHRVFKSWKWLLKNSYCRPAIKGFSVILITIHSKENLRSNLIEAGNYTTRTKIRRTAGPNSPDARAGKKCDYGLRDIGLVWYNTISLLYPHVS